jgi:iron complex transport system substrate-binding protein
MRLLPSLLSSIPPSIGCVILLTLLIVPGVQAEISVVDFAGRQVSLEQPAQRIIALAPHIVENTFSAGAGKLLVGVVDYSNYPAAAQDIHRVGNYAAWSMEEIVALQPDLILMWGSGNGMQRLVAAEKLGLTVYVSEPRELRDIATTIRAIGKLAGTDKVSEAEARRVELEIQRLSNGYREQAAVSVFYQVWNQPLQTINGDHLISHVIKLCGGRNIYDDAEVLAPRVNIESVLQRDPDAIIASGMDAARPEWLDEWKAFPSMQAVRENALFFIHPDLIQRPTTRILDGARIMCEQLQSYRPSPG